MTAYGVGLHAGGTASTVEFSLAAYVHLWPIVGSAKDWKTVVGFILAIRAKELRVWATRPIFAVF
jgi:hypothetical protein